jgi:hypothetical protein
VERVALALSVHTGWASCVVAGGSLRAPRFLSREIVEILGDNDRFVFHKAEILGGAKAKASVERVTKLARANAKDALRAVVLRVKGVASCAIVAKNKPMPGPLEYVIAAHPRIHTAEGCFFRDVFRDAAVELGLDVEIVPPEELEDRMRGPRTAKLLAAAGKLVGRPWSKDERLASLAAWQVLGRDHPSS